VSYLSGNYKKVLIKKYDRQSPPLSQLGALSLL